MPRRLDGLTTTIAAASAELRTLRRTVPFWIVTSVAVGVGVSAFAYYSIAHGIRSGYGVTAGSVAPRYLVHSFGGLLLLALLAGVVLLALEALARDRRDGVHGVLATRPISNGTLLAGKLAALVLAAWLSSLLLVAATVILGTAARHGGFWTGDFVEPLSLTAFVFLDALPTLAFWVAVTLLLATALRNRFAAGVAALALLGVQAWCLFAMRSDLLPVLSTLPRFGALASDMLPDLAGRSVLVHRAALLSIGGGFLFLAAATHPRRDGARPRHAVTGAALLAVGALGIAALLADAMAFRSEREDWIAAHKSARVPPQVDMEHVIARLAIDPGVGIRLDATLRMRMLEPAHALVFALNPGMEVEEVRVDGVAARHGHSLGLLRVDMPSSLVSEADVALSLLASGVPDPRFAYLDAVVDPSALARGGSLLHLLGTDASIFSDRYVALLPGVHWLPTPGPAFDDSPVRRTDFFEIDLVVEVPAGWLVAGPGRREAVGESPGAARFRPGASVPEVAVLASNRFERRAATVAGVEIELLFDRDHMRSVDDFRDAADELRSYLREVLLRAEGRGIPYPYDGLSLVEVPGRLRSFGGGWRMDTALAAPGIMMVREWGFPSARFEFALRERFGVAEVPTEAKLFALQSYFARDFSGGNVFSGVARNFLRYRTRASGPGSLQIDFMLEALTHMLVPYRTMDYFSAHQFADESVVGHRQGDYGTWLVNGVMGSTASVHNAVVYRARRAAVWEHAEAIPTADFRLADEPGLSLDAAYLRGQTLADLTFRELGEDGAAIVLRELADRHDGEPFAPADVLEVVDRIDPRFHDTLGEQLRQRSFPGFSASPLEVVRLADDARGQARYLARLHLHNGEAASGIVRLQIDVRESAQFIAVRSGDLVRVGGRKAMEIDMVSPQPPRNAWLLTHLSRNHGDIALNMRDPDVIASVGDEPIGSRSSAWRPRSEGLIVDDLDEGFAIVDADRLADGPGGGASSHHMSLAREQILPEFHLHGLASRWSRQSVPASWGRYRRTTARVAGGADDRHAVFSTTLPATGIWRLYYHLPGQRWHNVGVYYDNFLWRGLGQHTVLDLALGSRGRYDMVLSAGGERFAITFDAAGAGYGWHLLGEYDLKSRNVSLAVSSRGDAGAVVIADAVWWQRPRAVAATRPAAEQDEGGS